VGNLPVIDYVFIFLILLMLVHGYIKGFVEELFSWAAMILAIWAGVLLNAPAAVIVREKLMPNVRVVPEILAFIAIFLIVMIIVKLLERVLKDVIAGANLGAVNKVLGAVFGVIEGFAFTLLILFVISVQPLFNPSKILGDSVFAGFLLPIIRIPLERKQEAVEVVFLLLPKSLV
jgi:membrane protein required for colicin V production